MLGFWLCLFVVFWLRLCLGFCVVVVVEAVLTSCLPRVSSGFVVLFSCCCNVFPCAQHHRGFVWVDGFWVLVAFGFAVWLCRLLQVADHVGVTRFFLTPSF